MSTDTIHVPRYFPYAVALIIGGTMLAAGTARLTGYAAPPPPPPVVASVDLQFSDMANGGVAVRNAETGALIAAVPMRKDGFLRMTLRFFEAARQRENVAGTQPFELTEFAGGRMRLADPATGQAIELEAFGPSNIAEYAKFLPGAKP